MTFISQHKLLFYFRQLYCQWYLEKIYTHRRFFQLMHTFKKDPHTDGQPVQLHAWVMETPSHSGLYVCTYVYIYMYKFTVTSYVCGWLIDAFPEHVFVFCQAIIIQGTT